MATTYTALPGSQTDGQARNRLITGNAGQAEESNFNVGHLDTWREKTGLNYDRQGRMMKAAFEITKSSLDQARLNKMTWFRRLMGWLESLPGPLRAIVIDDPPNLRDFQRSFDLIHDWYPKLQYNVRPFGNTWKKCKWEVLSSIQKLLKEKKITADDDAMENEFNTWVQNHLDDETHKEQENGHWYKGGGIQPQSEEELEKAAWYTVPTQVLTCSNQDPRFEHAIQNLQTMHALLAGREATSVNSRVLVFLMPMFRVIWIIFMVDVLFLYEAIGLGMLTQLVFELNVVVAQPEEEYFLLRVVRILALSLLPIFVAIYAMTGAEMAELAHDSLQYPPFRYVRSSFIIFLSQWYGKNVLQGSLDKSSLWLIDFFLTWLLLILFVVGVLIACVTQLLKGKEVWMDVILHGLVSGGMVWTVFVVLSFVIARLYNTVVLPKISIMTEDADNHQAEVAAFRPARCRTVLSDAIATYFVVPGETWKYYLPLQRVFEIHREDDKVWNTNQVPCWFEKADEASSKAVCQKMISKANMLDATTEKKYKEYGWPLVFWIGTVCSCFCAAKLDSISWSLIIANLGMCLTLFSLSVVAKRTVPVFADNTFFRSHLATFVVLFALFSVVSFKYGNKSANLEPLMTVVEDGVTGMGIFYNDGTNRSLTTPYPVCSNSWGSPDNPVRILDLAAMSYYAYSNSSRNLQEDLLSKTFKNAKLVKYDKYNVTQLPRIVATRHCGSDGERCTIILAVRGTSTKLEVMLDIGVFATVFVMQLTDKFVSICGTLPVTLLGTLLDWSRLPFMRHKQDMFFKKIKDYAEELKENFTNDTLVITGHSLGGSFAEVAGAQLNIPAVGFSAPGQFYLKASFGTKRQSIIQNVLTIMPSLDVVPQVASHVDTVQRILCLDKNGEHRTSLQCHSVHIAMCELWRVCGDQENRSFDQACLQSEEEGGYGYVNEKCIGQSFNSSNGAQCKGTE